MDRFIVGTGRCGSTLLSQMIAEHPSVLSIFEFFTGLDMTKRFSSEPIDGEAFAALISQEHPFVTMVLSRGYDVPEITYPFGPNARYRRDGPLPWVLVSTLPRLTSDPDALFDEVLSFAAGLPSRPPVDHYRRLFAWLARRFGRACWIERSGSSIDYLGSLGGLFPDARFLHLHRDGPETALSMREHHAYRLAISLMYELPGEAEPSIAELRETKASDAQGGDRISRLLESQPPVELFGRYWSQELEHGTRAVQELRPEQYLDVRFETLVSEPARTLQAIATFFELDADDGWLERASGLIRGVPPTRLETLSAVEQERLAEACRAGMALLGRA